jgi:serine/threonine protein kinase
LLPQEFDNISQDAKDFISSILVKDPKERATAQDCQNHKWLKNAKQESEKYTTAINTTNLRKFLARRRWQRCGQAIR